jgi:two-component system, NarL family, nitrate/nitrite response regulator NarL
MASVYLIIEIRSYREALEAALTAAGLDVVGAADHPLGALWEIPQVLPDVTVMDSLGPEGHVWVRELRAAAPGTAVLELGVDEAEQETLAWAAAGVGGYVGRDASVPELTEAIEAAARGASPCHPRTAAILLGRLSGDSAEVSCAPWQCASHLTDREREIVQLIGEGLTNQQIARRCHIALATVKNHVHNVLEKVGVHRRADAVREIRRIGFLGRPERQMSADRSSATGRSMLRLVPGEFTTLSNG